MGQWSSSASHPSSCKCKKQRFGSLPACALHPQAVEAGLGVNPMFLRFKVRQLPLVISPLKNLGASNYSMLFWKYCCDSRPAFACQSHYRHLLAWRGYDSTHPFLYVGVCKGTVLGVKKTASIGPEVSAQESENLGNGWARTFSSGLFSKRWWKGKRWKKKKNVSK